MSDENKTKIPFGHAVREQFLFEPTWRNMNHGSFGTFPRFVRNAARYYQDLAEFAPDKFIRYQYPELLDEARRQVAGVVNAPADECVFVPNATTGVNVTLRNIKWEEKDAIIYFDTVYGACEKTLVSLQETNPQIHLRKVGYTLPCSHADLCTGFSQVISRLLYEGYKPKLAMFDTIVSMPGVRFPFERLTKICKEYDIFSLIDAAHAIGQIPLDLTTLDPDFLVTNCHKWLYAPRGCALYFVAKRNQHLIRTTFPTSHGFHPADPDSTIRIVLPPSAKSKFVNNFEFVGTVDNSPYLCIPAALEFRHNVSNGNESSILTYNRDLAQQGADKLAEMLGTKVMDDASPVEAAARTSWAGGLRDCSMANVLLPIKIEGVAAAAESDQDHFISVPSADLAKHIEWMQATIINEFDSFVQVFAYGNRVWTRVSGQIYLELSDFEWLGGVLKELLARVQKGEALTSSTQVKVKAPAPLDQHLAALVDEVSSIEISADTTIA